jgi:uncharacterized protein DUF4831
MRENNVVLKKLIEETTSTQRPSPQSRQRLMTRFALLAILVGVCVLASACFESKVVTSKVNPQVPIAKPTEMNGVFYALPRTVVKVDVPVVRVDKTPGQFASYTHCFFPDLVPGDDYIVAASTEFKVASDKIKFDTTFVPDTDEIYMIKTQGGMFETRTLDMELTESGVLVKASAEVTNEAIDIVTGTIKTGVGLVAKASGAGLFNEGVVTNFRNSLTREQRACWDPIEDAYQQERTRITTPPPPPALPPANPLTEQQIEAAMNPAIAKAFEDFQRATAAFRFISDLEKQRLGILNPENIPADALKLKLEELDKAIQAYKDASFMGTKTSLVWNASVYRLNPTNPARMSISLFSLSKTNGVCDVLANTVENQGVSFDGRFQISPCAADVVVKLEMKPGENGEGAPGAPGGGDQFSDKIGGLRESGKRGFFYRIPGRAIAVVVQERPDGSKKELGRAGLSIAQFGKVVSLPASTGGRKTKYTLALYEASGGLKNFSMGSSALILQKNIDDLAGAASTLIETKGERKKAKAPADELQQLERQRKILEEKKKIRDLEKDLDAGGPGSTS